MIWILGLLVEREFLIFGNHSLDLCFHLRVALLLLCHLPLT